MPAHTPGRWYWFTCSHPECSYHAVRYRNAKKCPRCGKPLVRTRKAKPEEA